MLLHDLFPYDCSTTKFDNQSHSYIHPRIVLENAKKITDINKLEEDIIVKHMFGATILPPKYVESCIVTSVDKICAIREVSKGIKNMIYNKLSMILVTEK